jgi:hypothetical protein
MPTDLLAELKKLQHLRSESSPFANHIEFNVWADKVLPLMAFDPKLQSRFRNMVLATNSARQFNITSQETENINSAIGMLNQAITSLEVMTVSSTASNPTKTEPVKPDKKPAISVVKIAEGAIGAVLASAIIYLIWQHFGIHL